MNGIHWDVADRVVFMDGGYIVEQGDPHEVIEHPKEERTRQFLARFAKGENKNGYDTLQILGNMTAIRHGRIRQ